MINKSNDREQKLHKERMALMKYINVQKRYDPQNA